MTLSLHLAREIRAFGKSAGRQFSATEIDSIEKTASSVATLDDAGQVRFDLGAGPVGSLDDALTMMSVGMGAPVTSKTSTPASSIPAGSNHTQRAVAMNAAIRNGTDTSKRDQAAALVRTWGNPWREGRINRTHAAYISNVAPDMASRLKAEAGFRS